MTSISKESLIVPSGSPVLREVALPVDPAEIGSKRIKGVIDKMKQALQAEDDGVAIAAPQIGESLRIFIVSGKTLSRHDSSYGDGDAVFINPQLVKASQKKRPMEEGCLSLRYLYGEVLRHEKVAITAYDDKGVFAEYGASGLIAQIFQHEMDHLDGVLFTDKAENVHDLPPLTYAFFGSSEFSEYVLDELKNAGFSPALKVSSAKEPLPLKKLEETEADLFIVASFGKILPQEVIEMPRFGSLNVHPSLLPELRGPSPIQNLILQNKEPGVSIIKMDEKMDHGPILAQEKVALEPWPDHYAAVEEKLGRAGGQLLSRILPAYYKGELEEKRQDESKTTFVKMIKKEDGLLDLSAPAEENYRKVLAYSTWPGAYLFFKRKDGKEIRVVIKDAELKDGKCTPTRVIPAGKKEMDWSAFLRGNA